MNKGNFMNRRTFLATAASALVLTGASAGTSLADTTLASQQMVGLVFDEIERDDESDLPRVRTDYGEYSAEGDPAIEMHRRLGMTILGCLFLVLAPRPGVRLVVYLGEMLEVEMGVDLRRADISVPEQLLHCTQVSGGFEQVACE